MDETALAATLAGSSVALLEVCAATATVPGPRSASSLPNHTIACMAAANAHGATTLSVIRALLSTAAGRAAIATIARDFISIDGGVKTVAAPPWVDPTTEQATIAVNECLKRVAAARLGTEYPFNATVQGGAIATPPVSLKPIDATHNTNQGSYYSAFLTACNARARPAQDFLAVPIPPSPADVPTFRVCNL